MSASRDWVLALRGRRSEAGLTTLEWLLVVAAVAGLAVVLVQNVVGDTAEQVASNDARQTAAVPATMDARVPSSNHDWYHLYDTDDGWWQRGTWNGASVGIVDE